MRQHNPFGCPGTARCVKDGGQIARRLGNPGIQFIESCGVSRYEIRQYRFRAIFALVVMYIIERYAIYIRPTYIQLFIRYNRFQWCRFADYSSCMPHKFRLKKQYLRIAVINDKTHFFRLNRRVHRDRHIAGPEYAEEDTDIFNRIVE